MNATAVGPRRNAGRLRRVGLAGAGLTVALAAALALAGPAAADTTTSYEADPASLGPIPNNFFRAVTFGVAGLDGDIVDVQVDFTMAPAHTLVQDLEVELIAPDGTLATIFDRPDDGSDVAGPYTFADSAPEFPTWLEAAASVDDGSPVPAGGYRASDSDGANTLITPAFAGLADPNGTWRLRFTDNFNDDVGSISAATLRITVSDPPATTCAPPAGPVSGPLHTLGVQLGPLGTSLVSLAQQLCTAGL
ncbi:MAG: hypothetical protein ACRDZN_01115 [Acidimicrobiales bacterium]